MSKQNFEFQAEVGKILNIVTPYTVIKKFLSENIFLMHLMLVIN